MTFWENIKRKWMGWRNNSGGSYDMPRTDAFAEAPEPNSIALLSAFSSIVFSCVSFRAKRAALAEIVLYAETDDYFRKDRIKGCTTKSISQKEKQGLKRRKQLDVKRVTDHHAFLDFIERDHHGLSFSDLLYSTFSSCDLEGNAYWHIDSYKDGMPNTIQLIPPHHMQIKENPHGYIEHYKIYNEEIDQDSILHFRFNLNPIKPYLGGMSPIRAAWGELNLMFKETSYVSNSLSNNSLPRMILNPPENESIPDHIAEKMGKKMYETFRHGNNAIFAPTHHVDLQALDMGLKDLSDIQLFERMKNVFCAIIHFPADFFEQGQVSSPGVIHNMLYSINENSIKPDLNKTAAILNTRLLPFFGDTVFMCFESPVPEDRDYELQKHKDKVDRNAETINEWRAADGEEGLEWGDQRRVMPGENPNPDGNNGQLQPSQDGQEPSQDEGLSQGEPVQGEPVVKTIDNQVLESLIDLAEKFNGGLITAPATSVLLKLASPNLTDEQISQMLVKEAPPAPQEPIAPPLPNEPTPPPKEEEPKSKSYPEFEETLRKVFRKLEKAALNKFSKKEKAINNFFDIEQEIKALSEAVMPFVEFAFNTGLNQTVSKYKFDPNIIRIEHPNIRKAIDNHVFVFADSTLRTLNGNIADEVEKVKQEFADGLQVGDRREALIERVKSIFQNLDEYGVARIADSETTRGINSSVLISGKEAGMTRKQWLSTDASDTTCEICNSLNGKIVGIDEPFDTIGTGVYSSIDTMAHPNCRCVQLLLE